MKSLAAWAALPYSLLPIRYSLTRSPKILAVDHNHLDLVEVEIVEQARITERETFRHSWRAKRWGPELDRIDRLKKALGDAERAGSLTLTFVSGLSSDDVVSAADAAEARVNAALAS